jgi:dihydrofolate reductase
MDRNGAIGIANGLPWRLRSDMAFFKHKTMGCCLVMGRKTYESIGKPLPGRTTIVLSKGPAIPHEDVLTVNSIEAALQAAEAKGKDVMLIGGAKIYAQTIGLVERLIVTHIDAEVQADAYFPAIGTDWKVEMETETLQEEGDQYPFRVVEYVRAS